MMLREARVVQNKYKSNYTIDGYFVYPTYNYKHFTGSENWYHLSKALLPYQYKQQVIIGH